MIINIHHYLGRIHPIARINKIHWIQINLNLIVITHLHCCVPHNINANSLKSCIFIFIVSRVSCCISHDSSLFTPIACSWQSSRIPNLSYCWLLNFEVNSYRTYIFVIFSLKLLDFLHHYEYSVALFSQHVQEHGLYIDTTSNQLDLI